MYPVHQHIWMSTAALFYPAGRKGSVLIHFTGAKIKREEEEKDNIFSVRSVVNQYLFY